MARIGVCVAVVAVLGCGLIHKDVDVTAPFVAGGGAPTEAKIDITTPLTASQGDLSRLSSVTLQAARIEATDGMNVSYITAATLSLHATAGANLPDLQIAMLPTASSTTRADLTADSSKDLKPYLQAGAVMIPKLTYSPAPASPHQLQFVLTVRGSL